MARLRFFICLFLFLTGCVRPIGRPSLTDSREWADLVEGIRFYEDRKYPEAAQVFLRIIDSYPGASLLAEAQWLLAKSYDASGKKGAAVQELQVFLKNFPASSHQEEARSLLFRLENLSRKVIAAFWHPALQESLEEQLEFYKNRGINAVIVPALSDFPAPGVHPDRPRLQEGLADWIQKAHLAGLQAIVRLPLREGKGLARTRPEWSDRRFDINKKQFEPDTKLDLFNAEVKEAFLLAIRDIARYPVDGIYVDAFAYRMDEGWTSSASDLYQNLFLERPDPLLFFYEPPRSFGANRSYPAASQFWHWIGWRSRYISSLLGDIQKEVEVVRPGIRFGVAVPEVSLSNPVMSLAELSIDFLELKRSKFDFYLISKSDASPAAVLSDTLSRYSIPPQEVWLQWSSADALPSHFSRSPFQGFVFLNP